jgi:hypothetical protein
MNSPAASNFDARPIAYSDLTLAAFGVIVSYILASNATLYGWLGEDLCSGPLSASPRSQDNSIAIESGRRPTMNRQSVQRSGMALSFALALLSAVLMSLRFTPTAAMPLATTRTYPGSAPCNTSLQACINGSADGDVINIAAGVYIQTPSKSGIWTAGVTKSRLARGKIT